MVDEKTVERFRNSLRGRLILPGEAGYDTARAVWNGMIDRRPALIAQCAGAADVREAVNFARTHNLQLTVKAGGHNVAGKAVCDDGLVVDVSQMNAVQVDPETQTARVGPGATWSEFDREAQAFSLATTGGVDSRTGVAGLTLGGGIGYLARKHGLTIDNLLAVDVITADGELRSASEEKNADLFWAVRGGGSNIGILTSFEFQLHEVGPEIMTAQIFHPFANARETLRIYGEFTSAAPDKLSCYAMLLRVPPVDPFPEAHHGQIAVALVACYAGSLAEGKEALAPLADFGDPILSAVMPMAYTTLQKSFDAGTPDGKRYYYKSQYLSDLSEEGIETILDCLQPLPGSFTIVGIEPMGGAIAEVDPTVTAYPHRNAAYNFSIWAGWSNPERDDEIIGWTRKFHEAMTPHATGGVYANYLAEDDENRVSAAYGKNYQRLLAVRKAWDPDGVFRTASAATPLGEQHT